MAISAEGRERLARDGIEAYAAGDVETALALFSPKVEIYAPPGEQITTGTWHGIEGFLQWSGEWNEAWESFTLELVDVEAVGDRHAVATVNQRGLGKGSGVEIEAVSGDLMELGDDEKCIFFALYNDPANALAAARKREGIE